MRTSLVWIPLLGGVVLSGCSGEPTKACTAPKDYWQKPHNFVGLMPKMNEVALDHSGTLYWNGTPVSFEKLGQLLKSSHELNSEPVVFLHTEMGVSCDALDALRNEMDEALECKKSHRCAEGIMSVWQDLPSPRGAPIS